MLGAALNAHGEDSANLDQDNVDVSSPLSSSIALDAAGCPRTLLHMPHTAKSYIASRLPSLATLRHRRKNHSRLIHPIVILHGPSGCGRMSQHSIPCADTEHLPGQALPPSCINTKVSPAFIGVFKYVRRLPYSHHAAGAGSCDGERGDK